MRVKNIADLSPENQRQVRELLAKQRATVAAAEEVPRGTQQPKPRSKFGNERTWVNGIAFGSKWEAQRYGELLQAESAGLIFDLQVHVSFALDVRAPRGDFKRIGAYEADFAYWREGRMVIEDTKSAPTEGHRLFLWKKAHFETQYETPITIVKRNRPRLGVEA